MSVCQCECWKWNLTVLFKYFLKVSNGTESKSGRHSATVETQAEKQPQNEADSFQQAQRHYNSLPRWDTLHSFHFVGFSLHLSACLSARLPARLLWLITFPLTFLNPFIWLSHFPSIPSSCFCMCPLPPLAFLLSLWIVIHKLLRNHLRTSIWPVADLFGWNDLFNVTVFELKDRHFTSQVIANPKEPLFPLMNKNFSLPSILLQFKLKALRNNPSSSQSSCFKFFTYLKICQASFLYLPSWDLGEKWNIGICKLGYHSRKRLHYLWSLSNLTLNSCRPAGTEEKCSLLRLKPKLPKGNSTIC